jgi:hypothetical protein
MIRFLFRFIGLMLLALGFIFVIYDGIRSISDGSIVVTKVSYIWSAIHERSQQNFQIVIEKFLGAETWQIGIAPVLEQPAAIVAGVLGIILIFIGRRKKPLIGYAR